MSHLCAIVKPANTCFVDCMGKGHAMAQEVIVLVGTTKGLFLYRSDEHRREWQLDGPYLPGWEIYSVFGDDRDGQKRIVAGTSHAAYGATVRISEDCGASWTQVVEGPSY